MKILTLNFLTCARKACKSTNAAFPLHPRDAELEVVETDMNPLFVRNILPRLEWDALRGLCTELGLPSLPESAPTAEELFVETQQAADAAAVTDQPQPPQPQPPQEEGGEDTPSPSQTLKDLHSLLLETTIKEGKLVCGNCGHEYAIKEGIANFLLPSHLV